MFTVRFHGRGGQGMKTASHFLGNAFFLAGYEVQDAPRYGAERRGAPMTSYVRADRRPIFARGIIPDPGLVVVADDSLIPIAAAGVLLGINENTVLLIVSRECEDVWQQRLQIAGSVRVMEPVVSALPLVSAACAGAAASLCGAIDEPRLIAAIRQELEGHKNELIEANVNAAREAYNAFVEDRGMVKQRPSRIFADYVKPDWIELPLETAELSAPTIHRPKTSVKVRTGLWRTQRPVIDYERCNRCWWVCSSSCPDAVIHLEEGNKPTIDYEHCKGCMICVAQCPAHAIESVDEIQAQQEDSA